MTICGQGAQDIFDALVRREQAEGEEHVLALDAELVLVKIGIDEGQVGNAVGDDVDFFLGTP